MTETIWLQRPGADVPWGFRLQGGRDNQMPLKVQRVTPGSIAATGLAPDDVVLRIGEVDTSTLTYAQAMDAIKNSGNMLQLLVSKKGVSGGSSVAPRPQVEAGLVHDNIPSVPLDSSLHELCNDAFKMADSLSQNLTNASATQNHYSQPQSNPPCYSDVTANGFSSHESPNNSGTNDVYYHSPHAGREAARGDANTLQYSYQTPAPQNTGTTYSAVPYNTTSQPATVVDQAYGSYSLQPPDSTVQLISSNSPQRDPSSSVSNQTAQNPPWAQETPSQVPAPDPVITPRSPQQQVPPPPPPPPPPPAPPLPASSIPAAPPLPQGNTWRAPATDSYNSGQPVGRSGPIQNASPQPFGGSPSYQPTASSAPSYQPAAASYQPAAPAAQTNYTPYAVPAAPPQQQPSQTPSYTKQRSVPESPPAVPDAVLNMAARGPPEKKPWSYVDMNSIKEQRDKVRRKNPVSTLPKYMHALNMPSFSEKPYPSQVPATPPPSDTAMVTHLQYNSPMDMYSGDNVIESLQGQTDGVITGIQGLSTKDEKDITLSPTYRMIHGLDEKQRPKHPLATARVLKTDQQGRPVREPAADDELTFSGVPPSVSHIPSKSFSKLQQMTAQGEIDTTSIRPKTEEEGVEIGNYDEASIRYLGRNIPSKSFKMLQNMTGAENNSTVRDQSLERRRQRKAPAPVSPEQNPDDIVDIRFVGGNIPSKSFQRLQHMVPPSTDSGSESDKPAFEEMHYMGHDVPSQSFKLLQSAVGSDDLKNIAAESRRRRRERLSREYIFDSPAEQTAFMDPRRKEALDAIAKEQAQLQSSMDVHPAQTESTREFDENAYLSGQIPIVSGEAKPVRFISTVTLGSNEHHRSPKDGKNTSFNEEEFLAGNVSLFGDPVKPRPPPEKVPEAPEVPWVKNKEDGENKEFNEDEFLKRKIPDMEPTTPVKDVDGGKGPGFDELHYMGKDVPSQSFKLLQSVVGKDDLKAIAAESRRRRRERLSRECVFDSPADQKVLMDPRRKEALEAIAREQQQISDAMKKEEEQTNIASKKFDEDEYLSGTIPLVTGEAKPRNIAQQNGHDGSEPSTPTKVTYLRKAPLDSGESVDSHLPPRPGVKKDPRRYRPRAPWERDDAETGMTSDAEFDESAFLSRGRLTNRSHSFGNDLDEAGNDPSPLNGSSTTQGRKFVVLRRSASADRSMSAPGSRSSTPYSMMSGADYADVSDMSESESEKPFGDMYYMGKKIPSKTFQRLPKITTRKRPTARKFINLSNNQTAGANDNEATPEAGENDQEKYIDMLKTSLENHTTETVTIQPEDEETDF